MLADCLLGKLRTANAPRQNHIRQHQVETSSPCQRVMGRCGIGYVDDLIAKMLEHL